jgi:hypothetical protein
VRSVPGSDSDLGARRSQVRSDRRSFRLGLTDGSRDYLVAEVARVSGELSLGVECHADKINVAPDQLTLPDAMKVIERQFKI